VATRRNRQEVKKFFECCTTGPGHGERQQMRNCAKARKMPSALMSPLTSNGRQKKARLRRTKSCFVGVEVPTRQKNNEVSRRGKGKEWAKTIPQMQGGKSSTELMRSGDQPREVSTTQRGSEKQQLREKSNHWDHRGGFNVEKWLGRHRKRFCA